MGLFSRKKSKGSVSREENSAYTSVSQTLPANWKEAMNTSESPTNTYMEESVGASKQEMFNPDFDEDSVSTVTSTSDEDDEDEDQDEEVEDEQDEDEEEENEEFKVFENGWSLVDEFLSGADQCKKERLAKQDDDLKYLKPASNTKVEDDDLKYLKPASNTKVEVPKKDPLRYRSCIVGEVKSKPGSAGNTREEVPKNNPLRYRSCLVKSKPRSDGNTKADVYVPQKYRSCVVGDVRSKPGSAGNTKVENDPLRYRSCVIKTGSAGSTKVEVPQKSYVHPFADQNANIRLGVRMEADKTFEGERARLYAEIECEKMRSNRLQYELERTVKNLAQSLEDQRRLEKMCTDLIKSSTKLQEIFHNRVNNTSPVSPLTDKPSQIRMIEKDIPRRLRGIPDYIYDM